MTAGLGIRSFGAIQNVTKPGGTDDVFGGLRAPKSTLGEMRVSAVLASAGYNIYYIMNDGVNGSKLVLLGTVTNANQSYPFKFSFRNNCTYGIAIYNPTAFGAPVVVVDLDVEEVEFAVGF